jgi:hypothetical protein
MGASLSNLIEELWIQRSFYLELEWDSQSIDEILIPLAEGNKEDYEKPIFEEHDEQPLTEEELELKKTLEAFYLESEREERSIDEILVPMAKFNKNNNYEEPMCKEHDEQLLTEEGKELKKILEAYQFPYKWSKTKECELRTHHLLHIKQKSTN